MQYNNIGQWGKAHGIIMIVNIIYDCLVRHYNINELVTKMLTMQAYFIQFNANLICSELYFFFLAPSDS